VDLSDASENFMISKHRTFAIEKNPFAPHASTVTPGKDTKDPEFLPSSRFGDRCSGRRRSL
jgi:hypothetical protein